MKGFNKRFFSFLMVFSLLFVVVFGCATFDFEANNYEKEDFSDDSPIDFVIDSNKKEIKILQLSDTQFYFSNDLYLQSKLDYIRKVVKTANPDIIVLAGDNIQGPFGLNILLKFIPFLDTLDVPYALVFGNHDPEGVALETQARLYYNAKNCLFKSGPVDVDGVGNYQINFVQNGKDKFSLFMLDSHVTRTYTCKEMVCSELGGTKYDHAHKNQVQWYKQAVEKTTKKNGKVIPSICFFHIPLPEHRYYKTAKEEDIVIPQSRYGGEKVSNCYVNYGFFDVAKELGSTKAILVGHNHINNFMFKKDGIILGYGLKTGYTNYHHRKLQGGTIITVKNDFKDIEIEHLFVEH